MAIKGTYIHYTQGDGSEFSSEGVGKKVLSQVKYLNRGGLSCSLQLVKTPSTVVGKSLGRLPFFPDFKDWPKPDADLSFYYIRKPDPISRDFLAFLDAVRAVNSKVKIVLEVPTWPYDGEMKNFRDYPKLLKDRYHRKRLASRIDRVVNFAGEDSLFGVPTIKTVNGIDFETIRARRSVSFSRDVHVLCAALFSFWHGIDRFLLGLKEYYDRAGDRKVVLHLMGEGSVLDGLKKTTHSLGLAEKVRFYGLCNQAKMDEVYDRCSLAVASLGLHRINLEVSSTLKSREYLAKGMPFVFSSAIDIFQEGVPDFCMQLPADESPVDVDRLIFFHDTLYGQEEQEALINRIRSYAQERVSMGAAMKPVVDFIKESRTAQ